MGVINKRQRFGTHTKPLVYLSAQDETEPHKNARVEIQKKGKLQSWPPSKWLPGPVTRPGDRLVHPPADGPDRAALIGSEVEMENRPVTIVASSSEEKRDKDGKREQ